MTQPITPTPADREAWEKFGPMIFYGDITGPEAFARHAAAAREEGYRAGIEAAVEVCEDHLLSSPDDDHQLGQSYAAANIAEEIRALAPSDGGQG